MSAATASERVERILSVLPWIVEAPGTTVAEVCERFSMSERDLRADLDLLMYEVGVHPFTPDARVDAYVDDDGRIFVHLGDYFRRPLRLTSDEGIVLYAAGQALLDRPDPDPVLSRAVDKLGAVLGDGVSDAVDVRLGVADPQVLSTVRTSTERGSVLHIDYYSFGRDEHTTRDVDPLRVTARNGHWYLTAWCHSALEVREFRIDRITTAEPTGESAAEHPDAVLGDVGDLSDGRPVVVVVPPGSEWILEAFPTTSVERNADGSLTVGLQVTADPWLARLMLRLGAQATATDSVTGADLAPLAAGAAARVLRRYS